MYGMKYTLIALLASSAICPLGLQAQITAGQTCDPAAANDCLASEPLSLQNASAATSRVIRATPFTLFEDLAWYLYAREEVLYSILGKFTVVCRVCMILALSEYS